VNRLKSLRRLADECEQLGKMRRHTALAQGYARQADDVRAAISLILLLGEFMADDVGTAEESYRRWDALVGAYENMTVETEDQK
jgi:hypothetical protein